MTHVQGQNLSYAILNVLVLSTVAYEMYTRDTERDILRGEGKYHYEGIKMLCF